jgi:NAD(P)-dependent dehydrogenase (short-subunit alcohol dehydrogenase family)
MVRQALDRFGRVDILINNAGAARGDDRVPVVDLAVETWRKVIDVNLTGTFLASRAVARQMIAQGEGGCILNISSIASRMAGPSAAAYSASKAGINAFSRALAMEMAPHRIRVNAVLPGVIETARMDDLGREERWEATLKRIPLGTAGNGMEIAYLCAYLCSDMGAWVTGQDLTVDGGSTWH